METPEEVVQVKNIISNRHPSVQRTRPTRQNYQTIGDPKEIVQEGGPGSGSGRFRLRSRTPQTNTMVAGQQDEELQKQAQKFLGKKYSHQQRGTLNQTIQYNTAAIADQTIGSSSNFGVRSVRSGRARNIQHQRNGLSSAKLTVDSTVSLKKSTGRGDKINDTPGPGAYNHSSIFPSGPKFVIQKKTQRDSLFLTKIHQNVSPGPAKYSTRAPSGGTQQSIGIKFNNDTSRTSLFPNAGPGAYETNSVTNLKRNPRATIGNSRRLFLGNSKLIPSPDKYSQHHRMTDRKSQSTERNAPRAIIGTEPKTARARMPTPGPSNYNTARRKEIGDQASVKIPFTTAVRPISARPGEIRMKKILPGPQDYESVNLDRWKKRSAVIPQCSFTRSGKDLESEARSQERAKSPGPNHYRPQSAVVLSRNPSCTIGGSKRSFQETKSRGQQKPGPGDYTINRTIQTGPKYPIARKYVKMLMSYQPGPSDYNYDQNQRLKRNPRATIGSSKKESCFERKLSPGPQDYKPKQLHWKRRQATVVFNKEKRAGIIKDRETSPGPGAYHIPCKFYDKPRFMLKKDNPFRFV